MVDLGEGPGGSGNPLISGKKEEKPAWHAKQNCPPLSSRSGSATDSGLFCKSSGMVTFIPPAYLRYAKPIPSGSNGEMRTWHYS